MAYNFNTIRLSLALRLANGLEEDFFGGFVLYVTSEIDTGDPEIDKEAIKVAELFAERASGQFNQLDVLDLVEQVLWGSGGYRELAYPVQGANEVSAQIKYELRTLLEAWTIAYFGLVTSSIEAAILAPMFGSE